MLRRTFIGTMAALPIVGVPFRAIGLAVSFETCRFTIRWESEPDAPDIVIALYSDESVRCWLGTKELTQPVMFLPIQKRQQWSFVGSDGEWSVDLQLRRQDFETIDLDRIVMWMGVGVDPRAGLEHDPVAKDYGIGCWGDFNETQD